MHKALQKTAKGSFKFHPTPQEHHLGGHCLCYQQQKLELSHILSSLCVLIFWLVLISKGNAHFKDRKKCKEPWISE